MRIRNVGKHTGARANVIKSFREMSRSGSVPLRYRLSTITLESIMSRGKWVVLECKIQGWLYVFLARLKVVRRDPTSLSALCFFFGGVEGSFGSAAKSRTHLYRYYTQYIQCTFLVICLTSKEVWHGIRVSARVAAERRYVNMIVHNLAQK